MSFRRSIEQLRPARYQKHTELVEKVQLLLTEAPASGLTTDNASITELFPCLAFNSNFKPSNVEDFKKFLYKLGQMKRVSKKTFVTDNNRKAGKILIDKLTTMEDRFVKTKVENAIGITNFLYELNAGKPIANVMWGYREKPRGIPKSHAGDIFVFFKNNEILGISLKAGGKKTKEPLLNTYVKTQLIKLEKEDFLTKLEGDMWTTIYSKIPGVSEVAKKGNYADGDRTRTAQIRQLYLDFFLQDEITANELYIKQTLLSRRYFCKAINSLSLDEFKNWVSSSFNLQKKGETVPLILVKAVGSSAEQKGDKLANLLPLVTTFNAYLNKSSVQEWFIDIDTPTEQKKLKMTIRSDAGVRKDKKLSTLGRLAKFSSLKMQYSGVLDR